MIKMRLEVRVFNTLEELLILLPLAILALIPSILYIVKKNRPDNIFPMPSIIILSGIFLVCVLPPNIFHQYFFYLLPFISFMACIGLFELVKWLREIINNLKTPYEKYLKVAATILIISVFFYSSTRSLTFINNVTNALYTQGLKRNPYDQAAFEAANYIANVTNLQDKIWTSEGAIAFFSQRLIVPPNSSNWPVSCFFSDYFGYVPKTRSYELEYRGDEIKDYNGDLLTITQFVQSWEENKVKAIVFIMEIENGTGFVPYPDHFIYEGFRSQEGAKVYVQQNYELKQNIMVPGNLYRYEIWIRK